MDFLILKNLNDIKYEHNCRQQIALFDEFAIDTQKCKKIIWHLNTASLATKHVLSMYYTLGLKLALVDPLRLSETFKLFIFIDYTGQQN